MLRAGVPSNETAIDGIPGIAGSVVEIEMDDEALRASLKRHWDASDASDFKVEHEIYRDDAVLDYPQSGERIRGRNNIQESHASSQTGSVSPSGELSAGANSGSPNSYLPTTAYHPTR